MIGGVGAALMVGVACTATAASNRATDGGSAAQSVAVVTATEEGVAATMIPGATSAPTGPIATEPSDTTETVEPTAASPTSTPTVAVDQFGIPLDDPRRLDPHYEEKMVRAQATPDYSRAPDPSLVPPPPDLPPLLRRSGYFRIIGYDDREISPERAAADPIERPGADEFASCLGQYGYVVDTDEPPGLITDQEIAAVVEAVNQDGPFVRTDGPLVEYAPNDTSERFLDCALTHLRL